MRVNAGSILGKIAWGIAYFFAILYIVLTVWPAIYCWQHSCRGPDLDAFMPAFFLSPWGAVACGFTLGHAIQHIRKKQSLWLFWPLAIIFGLVLLGTIAFLGWVIFSTAFHRSHLVITQPGK
jgi:hypothetical protein